MRGHDTTPHKPCGSRPRRRPPVAAPGFSPLPVEFRAGVNFTVNKGGIHVRFDLGFARRSGGRDPVGR